MESQKKQLRREEKVYWEIGLLTLESVKDPRGARNSWRHSADCRNGERASPKMKRE